MDTGAWSDHVKVPMVLAIIVCRRTFKARNWDWSRIFGYASRRNSPSKYHVKTSRGDKDLQER